MRKCLLNFVWADSRLSPFVRSKVETVSRCDFLKYVHTAAFGLFVLACPWHSLRRYYSMLITRMNTNWVHKYKLKSVITRLRFQNSQCPLCVKKNIRNRTTFTKKMNFDQVGVENQRSERKLKLWGTRTILLRWNLSNDIVGMQIATCLIISTMSCITS